MGFEVNTTAYGAPATALLSAQVDAAKGGDPLAPVTVLVPSNYAAVSMRRALAAGPNGVAAVDFVTLHRLAERLAGPTLAKTGRRPVSPPVLAQAVRAVLHDEPGIFEPVAAHPATEQALVAATRELAGVTDPALDHLAATGTRAHDVVRIARRVRDDLSTNWFDQHDLVVTAAELVEAGAIPEGAVIAHLLQELSPAGARLLQALAAHTHVVVNVGVTGVPDADRHVLDAHRRAGITVDTTTPVTPATAHLVVTVSDPDEEVRAAVRTITGWMRDGVRLGRTAVLYATPEPYARLLHEQLDAAGIAHNGQPVAEIGDMLLGRSLRRLLALPERHFARSEVMAVLTGAPLPGVPSRRWDALSRTAGVVQDDDWDTRLTAYAAEQRERAALQDDEHDRRRRHLERDAGDADALAAYVAKLRADLTPPDGGWAELAGWARGLVASYLGDERHRARWPEDEREAAERVDAALDRLGHLDAVGGPVPTLDVFRRTLDRELDVALRRVGRFGDGVLVGHVSMALGVEVDRVIVLGLAEGVFPPRRLEDSLLPDDERAVTAGELALRTERIHDDHRQLLAAVASAEQAVLSFPRGDLRRSGDRVPSRWLATVGAGATRTEVASFASGLVSAPFPATDQEHRLAAMATDASPVIAGDEVLAAGHALAEARRSPAFTRYDGNLSALGDVLPDHATPGAKPVSASRLQAYAACPHAYFGQYLLGVEAIEEPERALEMASMEKGTLVHAILETFLLEMIDEGRRPPWTPADADRLRAIAEDAFVPFEARGATGRAMFWRRDRNRILAELATFIRRDVDRDAGTPLAGEKDFEVDFPLPDGRSIRVRGSIDRVDRHDDGTLVVVDYKTGSSYSYAKLSADDPHQGGQHLQLAIYGVAADNEWGPAPVRAHYWFNSDKGGWHTEGYEITDAVRDEVGRAIATIVDGIRDGLFPMRPGERPYTHNDCWYCSPDDQGTRDLQRAWEQKRTDPLLAAYVALAEGEEEADDDDTD